MVKDIPVHHDGPAFAALAVNTLSMRCAASCMPES